MNVDQNILKVKIMDIEYPLKVNEDVEYIQKVASFVDRKMREIQSAKPERPMHQIAILACLNIADELHQALNSDGEQMKNYTDRIDQITNKLELGIQKSLEDDDQLTKFESDKNILE